MKHRNKWQESSALNETYRETWWADSKPGVGRGREGEVRRVHRWGQRVALWHSCPCPAVCHAPSLSLSARVSKSPLRLPQPLTPGLPASPTALCVVSPSRESSCVSALSNARHQVGLPQGSLPQPHLSPPEAVLVYIQTWKPSAWPWSVAPLARVFAVICTEAVQAANEVSGQVGRLCEGFAAH